MILQFIMFSLGSFPASELYIPTFRNTLSVPFSYEDGTYRVFRNVGMYNSDAGELPKRKHSIFRTRRKFEIKNITVYLSVDITFLSIMVAQYLSFPLSNSGVTFLCFALSTDCNCYLLPSDLLKLFWPQCVKINDSWFMSLSAIPWTEAVLLLGGGISILVILGFTPVIIVTARRRDQDGSGGLLSILLQSLR